MKLWQQKKKIQSLISEVSEHPFRIPVGYSWTTQIPLYAMVKVKFQNLDPLYIKTFKNKLSQKSPNYRFTLTFYMFSIYN